MANARDLWKQLDSHSTYLITSHVRPDPDAIGSEIALALYLEKLGKRCQIVNENPLPATCEFLPAVSRIAIFPAGMDFPYEAFICLDAPEVERTGLVGSGARDVPILILDHHPYENKMADFAWIDPTCSSTGELLYTFMVYRRELIDADIATALYAAILTDTGRFTFTNTSGRTLAAAADLVSLGARPAWIAEQYYENVPEGYLYIMGLVATRMKRAGGGKVAYTTLTGRDFDRAGVGPEVAQELAGMPRSIKGVEVGILFREIGEKVKVSLRSKGRFDVKRAAEHFGGGGHREASGFLLELPMDEAEILVIKFMEEQLKGQ